MENARKNLRQVPCGNWAISYLQFSPCCSSFAAGVRCFRSFPFCQMIWADGATDTLYCSSLSPCRKPRRWSQCFAFCGWLTWIETQKLERGGCLRVPSQTTTSPRYTHSIHNSRSTLCLYFPPPTCFCCFGRRSTTVSCMRWNSCFLLCVSKTTKQQGSQCGIRGTTP